MTGYSMTGLRSEEDAGNAGPLTVSSNVFHGGVTRTCDYL